MSEEYEITEQGLESAITHLVRDAVTDGIKRRLRTRINNLISDEVTGTFRSIDVEIFKISDDKFGFLVTLPREKA